MDIFAPHLEIVEPEERHQPDRFGKERHLLFRHWLERPYRNGTLVGLPDNAEHGVVGPPETIPEERIIHY